MGSNTTDTTAYENIGNNYVIDDWGEFKSEWYYLDGFEVDK